MACQNNRRAAVNRKPAHQCDELPCLRAVVFISSEHIGHGIDNKNLRSDGDGLAFDLFEQRRWSNVIVAVGLPKDRVLAHEIQNMQPVAHHFSARGIVMLRDGFKSSAGFVVVIFATEIDHRAGFRHDANPIAGQHG